MATIEHESCPQPSDATTPVWRYMNFSQFVSMLEQGGLFFCQARRLRDPWEGTITMADLTEHVQFARTLQTPDAKAYLSAWGRMSVVARFVFVNCWHMSEHESEAMWKLYSLGESGVAIKSSYVDLCESLDDRICLGMVKYVDYDSARIPHLNALSPFMQKRRSFAHEREVRAIQMSSKHEGDPGVWEAVNLESLINKVYVGPLAPAWFVKLIVQVVRRYELNIPVAQSQLADKPVDWGKIEELMKEELTEKR